MDQDDDLDMDLSFEDDTNDEYVSTNSNSRALEIRRKIEDRLEEKRLREELGLY
ncbi:MAG: hypothetical protein O3B72_08945 [Proteobacteria bacterium]|nr:hypothetical protein [Pseudomonadota bacterium]